MEFIDGHPVVDCRVRFRLRTTVDDEHVGAVRDGDTIIWVVRALCLPPQYYPLSKDAEERYKLAIQDVDVAVPLTGESRQAAIAFLDGSRDQLTLPFDQESIAPSESGELAELRLLLDELGGVYDDETLADAVRRLTAPPQDTEPADAEDIADENYVAALALATAVLHEPEDEPEAAQHPINAPEHDVEIVGSIYRGGRSKLVDLLDEKFGDPH